jgi:hypothetical protein
MHRLGIIRKWRPVAVWLTLTCLAAACGGGNDGGTGPGGGGGGGDLAGDYLLVAADDNAVPAVVNSPVCGQSQVLSGGMTLYTDGTWQLQFNWQDDNGVPDFVADHGRYKETNNGLQFTSDAWGDQFDGQLDGGLIWVHYDFCNDNQGPDLYLGFGG